MGNGISASPPPILFLLWSWDTQCAVGTLASHIWPSVLIPPHVTLRCLPSPLVLGERAELTQRADVLRSRQWPSTKALFHPEDPE